MGTWKMNVAKSTGENATPPREQTRIHEDRGNGFVLVIRDTVGAQGQKGHIEYAYKPDGKDYPMAGLNEQEKQTTRNTTSSSEQLRDWRQEQ